MLLDPLTDPRIFVWPKIPLLLLSLHSLTCGAHTSASPSISFLLQPSPLHGLLTSAPPTPRAPPACSPAGRAPSPPAEPLPASPCAGMLSPAPLARAHRRRALGRRCELRRLARHELRRALRRAGCHTLRPRPKQGRAAPARPTRPRRRCSPGHGGEELARLEPARRELTAARSSPARSTARGSSTARPTARRGPACPASRPPPRHGLRRSARRHRSGRRGHGRRMKEEKDGPQARGPRGPRFAASPLSVRLHLLPARPHLCSPSSASAADPPLPTRAAGSSDAPDVEALLPVVVPSPPPRMRVPLLWSRRQA